jgi:hypothetical protein
MEHSVFVCMQQGTYYLAEFKRINKHDVQRPDLNYFF